MEDLVKIFADNPVYLGIAVVLAGVILFGIIKKLIKLALVVAAVLVIYVAYLVWTGEEVNVDRIKEGVQSAGDAISEKVDEITKSAKEKAVEKSQEAVGDILDK